LIQAVAVDDGVGRNGIRESFVSRSGRGPGQPAETSRAVDLGGFRLRGEPCEFAPSCWVWFQPAIRRYVTHPGLYIVLRTGASFSDRTRRGVNPVSSTNRRLEPHSKNGGHSQGHRESRKPPKSTARLGFAACRASSTPTDKDSRYAHSDQHHHNGDCGTSAATAVEAVNFILTTCHTFANYRSVTANGTERPNDAWLQPPLRDARCSTAIVFA